MHFRNGVASAKTLGWPVSGCRRKAREAGMKGEVGRGHSPWAMLF